MRHIALATLAVSMAMAQSNDVPALIAALSQANNTTRVEAAALLREKLAANPSSRMDDHGEEYWKTLTAQVRPGMKEAQARQLLPPSSQTEAGVIESSAGRVAFWRLDAYWKVTVQFHNPDLVAASPTLNREAMAIWVQPRVDYTGAWVNYYVSGQTFQERQYNNGKLSGSLTQYHDNGQKAWEQQYVEGACVGSFMGWYRDGSKADEGQCANGKFAGGWTHWREDGTIEKRDQFKGGQLDGVSTSWHPNGQIEFEVHYKDGKKNGLDRAWDPAGKLLWSREYLHGELVAK